MKSNDSIVPQDTSHQSRVTKIRTWLLIPYMLSFLAIALWITSLKAINVSHLTDLGLVSTLPATFYVALLGITISFAIALHWKPLHLPLLVMNIILLIVMLFGVTIFVETMPRFSVAWRHLGVVDYIARKGSIDPRIDAYFNWPSFFILSAFAMNVAGLPDLIGVIAWAPVFFNLLYLCPLLMLLSAATDDRRIVWLGAWLFYLTNWIGQDYYSPQGLNYFFFLTALAILLKWFKVVQPEMTWARTLFQSVDSTLIRRWGDSIVGYLTGLEKPNEPSTAGQRVGLTFILALVLSAIIASHQITPVGLLIAITLLVVINRCSLRGLPVLMATIFLVWLGFLAITYMQGHYGHVASGVGHLAENVRTNLIGRLKGSIDHLSIVYLRLGLTVILWGLALTGAIRRLRHGYKDVSFSLLSLVMFSMIGLASYGGEVILRVYLFNLPFVLFFVASLFFPIPSAGTSWRVTALIGMITFGMSVGFLFCRYGNERMDYKTVAEIEAIGYVYNHAEANSFLVALAPNLTWKYRDYEVYHYYVAKQETASADVNAILTALRTANRNSTDAYLIVTRSQEAYAEIQLGLTPEQWHGLLGKLAEEKDLELVFSNADAVVFRLPWQLQQRKIKP